MKHLAQYVEAAEKAVDLTWWKAVFAVLAAVFSYFFPDGATQHLAMTAAVFVVLDTITGIRASMVGGSKIESAKLGRILSKLVGYGAIIIVARLIPEATRMPEAWQGMSVAGFLGLVVAVEGVSILENVARMKVLPKPIADWLRERVGRD